MREMLSWSKERVLELRRLEFAFGLADQVIDLGREDAVDFKLDHRHAARPDRELPFAAQGEQSAITLDLDFLRQLGAGRKTLA